MGREKESGADSGSRTGAGTVRVSFPEMKTTTGKKTIWFSDCRLRSKDRVHVRASWSGMRVYILIMYALALIISCQNGCWECKLGTNQHSVRTKK